MNVIQNSNQIECMFYDREYMMDQTNTHQIDVNFKALEEPFRLNWEYSYQSGTLECTSTHIHMHVPKEFEKRANQPI